MWILQSGPRSSVTRARRWPRWISRHVLKNDVWKRGPSGLCSRLTSGPRKSASRPQSRRQPPSRPNLFLFFIFWEFREPIHFLMQRRNVRVPRAFFLSFFCLTLLQRVFVNLQNRVKSTWTFSRNSLFTLR